MTTDRIKKVPKETRVSVASAGGSGRAAALTAEQRSEIARQGAMASNSPLGLARRIRTKWAKLSAKERREVAEVLSGCRGLIASAEPKPAKATRSKASAEPAEAA